MEEFRSTRVFRQKAGAYHLGKLSSSHNNRRSGRSDDNI